MKLVSDATGDSDAIDIGVALETSQRLDALVGLPVDEIAERPCGLPGLVGDWLGNYILDSLGRET